MNGVQTLSIGKKNNYDGTVINGGLIWGDGPEAISSALLDTAAYGRALTNVKLVAGRVYEVEYYMSHHAGTSNNLIMGIGVKNTSTSQSGSVTLLKAAEYTVNGAGSVMRTKDTMVRFMNNSQSKTMTVNPGTSSYSDQGFTPLLNTSSMSDGQTSNGRVRFKVNSGGSLYLKIFFVKYGADWQKRAGWTNIISATDLQKNDPNGSGTKYADATSFTGLFANVARTVEVDNLNPFRICWGDYDKMDGEKPASDATRVIDHYNTNEFEDPTNALPYKRNGNKGNFGVVYTIYCSNTSGKYITIKPARAAAGNYTVKINGTWMNISATSSQPYKAALTGGRSIWFALNGGNSGDIEIQYTSN